MQPVPWNLKFENMSPDQLSFVKSMKVFSFENGIDDPWFTLFHVFRFCMARQFHPEEVRKLIAEYAQFRKKHLSSGALASPCNPVDWELAKAAKDGFFCVDRKFRPVFVIRSGAKNVESMMANFGYEAVEAYYTQLFERFFMIFLPICSALKGKRVSKCVIILDLKDMTISKLLSGKEKDFTQKVSYVSQNFFPQIMKKVYLINAPILFETAWKVLKIFLHPVTAAKFEIFKGVPAKVLQKEIGVENLHRLHSGSRGEDFFTHPGPWTSELELALRRRSNHLSNPTPFLQFFCTEEERTQLAQLLMPKVAPAQPQKVVVASPSSADAAHEPSEAPKEKALSEGSSHYHKTPVSLSQMPQVEVDSAKPIKKTNFLVGLKNLKIS